MRTMFVDPARQQAVLEKGCVRVPLLSSEEVAFIMRGLQDLRPDDKFAPSGSGGFQFTYHCTFLDTNVDYKRKASNLIRQVFSPHVKRVMVNYEMLNCNFYVKPPGRGEFQIHQNWPALADMNDTTLTIWCPLVDADESNGTLQVVEGSHKLVPDIAGPTVPPYFRDFQEALIRKYLRPICLTAGDALIFDDSLVHWSAQNNSDVPRYAIQILCTPADATPVIYYSDPHAPDKFELFEVDSEYFIEHTISDFLQRPTHLRSLGFVDNKNRCLSEEEFAARLKEKTGSAGSLA